MNILVYSIINFASLLAYAEKEFASNEELKIALERIHVLEISAQTSKLEQVQLKEEVAYLRNKCEALNPVGKTEMPDLYTYEKFACEQTVLTLDCPSNRNISITEAKYGVYEYSCDSGTCCNPHPTDDCIEFLEDQHPQDWLALKAICDGKPSCDVIVTGSLLYSCESEVFDYIHVRFSCLPETTAGVVAFAAYLRKTTSYVVGEIVLFGGIITNSGECYNPDLGIFSCPETGIYFLSLSLGCDAIGTSATIAIEGAVTVTARCHYESQNQGSATIVTECTKGQRVWAEIQVAGTVYGDLTLRYTSLTGYLLQQY